MSRRRRFAAAAIAAAALACATGGPRHTRTVGSPAAEGLPASELVCTMDYDTGSNIPTRSCRTKAEAQADRDQGLRLPGNAFSGPTPAQVQRGGGG